HKLTQEATKPDDEKFVPLRTCQHQLTRKELKDYSVQSTTSENSFPIWHLSMNPLGCFCERILNFSGHMSKTKPFKKLRLDELTELNSVILRGGRFFIPTSMRKEMFERIHQGHMVIEKSKQRA
ncbi:unnamed protein product, partial [Porites lobata]